MAGELGKAVTNKTAQPEYVERLTDALTESLRKAGINAEVSNEPVPRTKLRRFYVISKNFKDLRPSERQDLVWRIASQVLDQDEQLLISIILTFTPDELAGK